jgi:hypothetical protein
MRRWILMIPLSLRRDWLPASHAAPRPLGARHLWGTGATVSRHLVGAAVSVVLMLLLLACLARPAGAQQVLSASAGVRLGAGASANLAAPQTITVTFQQGTSPVAMYSGVADAYISSEAGATNYGQALELRMAYDGRYRILLRFDLADYIPQMARVTGAKLELYTYYSEHSSVSTDVYVYELLRPWTETGVTWTQATADTTWQQVGCEGLGDRSLVYTAVARFDAITTWQVWHNDLLTELVQRWVSDPEHNYGVILLGLNPLDRQFWIQYSSQIGGASAPFRPRLTVSYYIPESTPTPTTIPIPTNTLRPSATPIPSRTPTATQVVTTAAVGGVAWRDENSNRQRDLGEPPMSAITVILRNSAHLELGRRMTIGDGSYEFGNLAHGSYLLTKEDPPGLHSTLPSDGAYAFYLAGGQRLAGMNFGFSSSLVETSTTVPTETPTARPTATPTRTPTRTGTAVPAQTPTDTRTATITLTPLPGATGTHTPTLPPTPTRTVTPTPQGAPAGTLQDPIPIVCEGTYSSSTAGYPSVINDYGMCGAGMGGPETVYIFQTGHALDWLSISLDTPADLSLFVLSSANPAACLAGGGSVVVSSVAAGVTFYVVVDGSQSGSYTMQVHCYPPPLTTPTLTPTRTPTGTGGSSPTPTKTRTPGGGSTIYLPLVHKPILEFLVDCGADANYLDSTSRLWLADRAYAAGAWGYVGDSNPWSTNQDIVVNTPGLMRLYQTVRHGYAFGYQFDVPNGNYHVELHFAEVFWNKAEQRVFDVILEGQTVLYDFDIFSAAGEQKLRSVVRSFTAGVSDGQLNVDFVRVEDFDFAMINAIRVTQQ